MLCVDSSRLCMSGLSLCDLCLCYSIFGSQFSNKYLLNTYLLAPIIWFLYLPFNRFRTCRTVFLVKYSITTGKLTTVKLQLKHHYDGKNNRRQTCMVHGRLVRIVWLATAPDITGTRPQRHTHLVICYRLFNPLKGRGVNWLHFAIQV